MTLAIRRLQHGNVDSADDTERSPTTDRDASGLGRDGTGPHAETLSSFRVS